MKIKRKIIPAISILFLYLLHVNQSCAQQTEIRSIPWGAMYAPLDIMKSYGMTGTITYYRGDGGVKKLFSDLAEARRCRIKLIITLGDVRPSTYADQQGKIDMAKVREELSPFVKISGQLRSYIEDGTIWAIRFMDEPHDPSGLPQGISINTEDLGAVMLYLKQSFGSVRVGSTAPARYMVNVSNADWCFGQYCHRTAGRRGIDPVQFIKEDAALAKKMGMSYVASLNASTNPVDNKTFFETYLAFASIPDVDFLTSWQWQQGRYPSSFEKRITDPSVRSLVTRITQACMRK